MTRPWDLIGRNYRGSAREGQDGSWRVEGADCCPRRAPCVRGVLQPGQPGGEVPGGGAQGRGAVQEPRAGQQGHDVLGDLLQLLLRGQGGLEFSYNLCCKTDM